MIARSEGPSSPVRWTIAELLRWTEDYFRRLELESPRLDAEVLLAEALGSTRLDLYTQYQKLVEPEERARYRSMVERRARREPVAYITGTREFYSLKFAVSPAVLVPRPETEHVVQCVLEELGREGRPASPGGLPQVLDLGTGSGNIAIAVAVNALESRIDAVDSSDAALTVARTNAGTHGVLERIRFLQGDWFGALPRDAGPYAVMASNPPYISREDYEQLMEDVRLYEPRGALCDLAGEGGDGLGYYRLLASKGAAYLGAGGLFVVEIGLGQAEQVTGIFLQEGWQADRLMRDYGGVERVLSLRRP